MNHSHRTLTAFLLLAATLPLGAQVAPANTSTTTVAPPITEEKEETIVLSPFEVKAEDTEGYLARTTLAGNRLNTDLRDIGNAVSIITPQFLKDINATSNDTLLAYTLGTEVGNVTNGNFAGVGDAASLDESGSFRNPNNNTRVRGLAGADNSRNLFLSETPWDGYNMERIEIQRGPNAVLFGQGSPAGIINLGTKQASFKGNFGEVSARYDQRSGTRFTGDYNLVVLKDELAVRLNLLRDREEFQQDPAFDRDQRAYASLRYEPKFMKIGGARTIIKANYERMDLNSNRPRSLPPIDLITPWFNTEPLVGVFRENGTIRDPATGVVRTVKKGDPRVFPALNRRGFDPRFVQDDNTSEPDRGQTRPKINGGPNTGFFNPAFNPVVGNFAQQFGGTNAFFATPGATPGGFVWEPNTSNGIGPTGARDGGVGTFVFTRPVGIATQSVLAFNAGLPFGQFGIAKDFNLTDPGLFDFFNNLIDGPNKREWQNSKVFEASIAQTFWNDMVGIEYGRFDENYNNGQLSLLTGSSQAIFIDMNSVLTDGTPNANFGRPFISSNGVEGNNSTHVVRNVDRVTAFLDYDFNKDRKGSVLSKFVGRQTVTGLYDNSRRTEDERRWERFAVLDPAFRPFVPLAGTARFDDNFLAVNRVVYLGPSLVNIAGPSSANIPRPDAIATVPGQLTVRGFDSTWNAPNVDPAAPWENPRFPVGDTRRNSTQSENAANYIGFVDRTVNVTDSETSQANRDRLTRFARKRKTTDKAKSISWQGSFWNNAVVTTYSRRHDKATSREFSFTRPPNGPDNALDLGPDSFALPEDPDNSLTKNVNSYSVVTHLDQLPFLGKLTEKLPVALSLTWAKTGNGQPEAARRDILGNPIAAPSGGTKEKGFIIETRDGRFGLRVNHYKTKLQNSRSNALNGAWFLGASQAWSGNWVNIFNFNLSSGNSILANRSNVQDPSNPNATSRGRYTYGTAAGETAEDAARREAAAIAAWRGWQKRVEVEFPGFYQAWGINTKALADGTADIVSSTPNGFAVTEDSISKGWEFELNANPTRTWRISVNASKTNAVRTNIGGTELRRFAAAYEDFLLNQGGGDLRIWWGGAGNETALFQYNQNIGAELTSRTLQEGTNVPELREWRVNAISTYEFDRGWLKGFSVGGGVRWQDSVTIGFTPITDPTNPNKISFDLAQPFTAPTETNIDLWAGYTRKLTEKINWRIQFNITNVGKDNDLIGVTSQPDGTTAGQRIAPHQQWSVTNTFTF